MVVIEARNRRKCRSIGEVSQRRARPKDPQAPLESKLTEHQQLGIDICSDLESPSPTAPLYRHPEVPCLVVRETALGFNLKRSCENTSAPLLKWVLTEITLKS